MPCSPVAARPEVAAQVSVSVSGDETIICSPDPIDVKSGQNTIEFRVVTAGYVFPKDNAIVVENPGRDFPRPSVTSEGGAKATLRDRDLDQKSYKYTVYLRHVASGRIISVDPVIRNDPD